MEQKERAKQLLAEFEDLSKSIMSIQNTSIGKEERRSLADRYYEWYAEVLAILPADLEAGFRDSFENGTFTMKIQAFLADPLAENPLYDPTQAALADPRRYSYDKNFAPYAERQRQILIEASHLSLGQGRVVSSSGPVFVVHGHNEGRLHEVARLIENSTDRDAVVLREQVNAGRTIVEKFEDEAVECSFAVVLLTGDDLASVKGESADTRPRARQNVVFEAGYFMGILGRHRVVLLHEVDVELPSDLSGVVYISLSGSWKIDLAREFEAAGIAVDYARLT